MSTARLQQGLGAGACLCALVALAISFARGCGTSLAEIDHTPGLFVDFGIYYSTARHIVNSELRLHENWLYPPLAAALVAGFGLLPPQPARALWAIVQALSCLGLTALCAEELRSWRRRIRWLVASALVASALPIWHCLKWGQMSVLIVASSLFALTRKKPELLGFAAGIKLYPACYAILYVMRREPGPLIRCALATIALGVIVPLIVLGLLFNAMAWGRVLGTFDQIGSEPVTLYQTLPALIAKWFGSWPQLVQLLLTAAACTAVIAFTWLRVYQRRKQPVSSLDAACIVLGTTLLVAPAWVHYYAGLPFAHAVLLSRADRLCTRLWFLVASYAFSTLPLCLTLLAPEFFSVVSATGLTTLSAAFGLIGLWACPVTELSAPHARSGSLTSSAPAAG